MSARESWHSSWKTPYHGVPLIVFVIGTTALYRIFCDQSLKDSLSGLSKIISASSQWGLTKALLIVRRHVLGSIRDEFLVEPIILLQLLNLVSRYSINVNLVSGVKPDILTWDWLKESDFRLLLTILQEQ